MEMTVRFSLAHIPDDEGDVFIALAPELFPGVGIFGREWQGELYFTCRLPLTDKVLRQRELRPDLFITGPEAIRLLRWAEEHPDIAARWEYERATYHQHLEHVPAQ
jgi:hypothetical protein